MGAPVKDEQQEYTIRIQRWMTPIIGIIVGAMFTFVVTTSKTNERVDVIVAQQQKQLDDLKTQRVTKELFDATTAMMQADIKEMKASLRELVIRNPPVIVRRYNQDRYNADGGTRRHVTRDVDNE